MERANDMNRQFLFLSEELSIELPSEGIVLFVVGKADLVALDDTIENRVGKLFGNGGQVRVRVLDVLFNVLLFVGEELIEVAIALNVGLLFEQIHCFGHFASKRGQIAVE